MPLITECTACAHGASPWQIASPRTHRSRLHPPRSVRYGPFLQLRRLYESSFAIAACESGDSQDFHDDANCGEQLWQSEHRSDVAGSRGTWARSLTDGVTGTIVSFGDLARDRELSERRAMRARAGGAFSNRIIRDMPALAAFLPHSPSMPPHSALGALCEAPGWTTASHELESSR